MKRQYITLLMFVVIASAMYGQDAGTLDPSFNGTGTVVYDRDMLDIYQDVKVQPDGKIVTVGNSISPTYSVAVEVTRYLPDGSFDESFGNGGHYNYAANTENMANSCLILDDGKILLCGHTTDYSTSSMLLIKLDEQGVPDPSFGNNGIVIHGVGTGEQTSFALALQEDGKILIAGYALNAEFRNAPVVVRFEENGTLDTSFGNNGVATVPVTETDNDFSAVCVQSDGKILAAGHISNGMSWFSLLIARFDENGNLDDTYGTGGIVNKNLNNVDDEFFDMQLHENGESVLAGFTVSQSDFAYHLLLMKFDIHGQPVSSFGDDGVVMAGTVPYTVGNALSLQADGKILAAGSTGELAPGNNDWALWRFNSDGTPDTDFGTNGLVTTEFFGNSDEALGIALYEDKIVVAGKTRNADNQLDFAVARYINDFNVGVTLKEDPEMVSVSPNPVKKGGIATVGFTSEQEGIVSIELIDPAGHTVQKYFVPGQNKSDHSVQIRIPEQITPGIYFLHVTEKKIPANLKLIVTE